MQLVCLFSHKVEAVRQICLCFLVVGLFVGFAGCAPESVPEEPKTESAASLIERLRMSAPAGFGVQKIEIKSVVQAAQAPELFTREGLESSAYYKYWRADGAAYKVRLNVYESVADLEQGWEKRFPSVSLATAEPMGDGYRGFVQRDKIDAVLIEVSASKQPDRLADFTRAYADYVEQVLASTP